MKLEDNTQVIVLASPERCINYKWFENADKIDNQLQLLTSEYVGSSEFPCQIDKSNGLKEGMILIRNPFNATHFVNVTDLEDQTLKYKLNAMNDIGLRLGAKSIEIYSKVENSEQRDVDVNVDGNFKVAKGKVDVKVTQDRYSSDEYKIISKNPETIFTEESYREAIQKANESGLINEPRINSLLQNRNPKNPFFTNGKFEVQASALEEANKKLDIAVSASYLVKFNVDINVAVACVSRNKIVLNTIFEF